MATYAWRNGDLVNVKTGEPLQVPDYTGKPFPCPNVVRDIPDYRSPIDGRVISSRSERREDLKRNGCIEAAPRKPTEFRKARYRNAQKG